MSLKMSRLNFDTLIIQYNAAIRKVNQIPLCTPILTFAPPFWHLVRPLKKGQFWHPKKGKTGPKKRDIFRIHIGVDFLQKTGPKLLKICPCGAIYILHQLIWGRHPVPCLSTQISKRQGTAMYYLSTGPGRDQLSHRLVDPVCTWQQEWTLLPANEVQEPLEEQCLANHQHAAVQVMQVVLTPCPPL